MRQQPAAKEEWISLPQFAAQARVAWTRAYRACLAGEVVAEQLGNGRWRVLARSVAAFTRKLAGERAKTGTAVAR
jgi:hypothetical protein